MGIYLHRASVDVCCSKQLPNDPTELMALLSVEKQKRELTGIRKTER
jgi:hypothetical protein